MGDYSKTSRAEAVFKIASDLKSARDVIENNASRKMSFPEDFWRRVDQSGGALACWPWKGRLTAKGYGYASIGGNSVGAHRVAYYDATGFYSQRYGLMGHCVRHLCHNPSCCNPSHLLLGRIKDNKWDDRARASGIDLVEIRRGIEAIIDFNGAGDAIARHGGASGFIAIELPRIRRAQGRDKPEGEVAA